ncbi:CPBP family intramembrane metalloprotease [Brevundimonas naejangsanensis]|uniref:CPBP family intramembrane metalloprotease n=2 Tax=Brevundimonas naejangsanensis TaxID=588932 RepID=A0A494RDM4_9CAUL|nr:CPBP family intramembrane glutamic endopeptidase [Brevundimonas naejangsanensis]AYG94405.1 CPBP family intramembrane metalloprotease [Brevundimonas naejangsanensis]
MSSNLDAPAADFRRPFRGWLAFNVRTGLILLALFGVTRFALVMLANVTRDYGLVSFFFIAMALTPLLLLTRSGRVRIGLNWRPRLTGLGLGVLLGAGCCVVLIATAGLLFGPGDDNAFTYVAGTYSALPDRMSDTLRLIMFAVFALIGMTFSPIGEELFYRGLVHESFVAGLGENRAALVDAAAFALVHLAHFGLVWRGTGWALLPLPALWWLCGLFAAALAFTWARRASGSILGAVAAHAAFNLVMTAWIFYGLRV